MIPLLEDRAARPGTPKTSNWTTTMLISNITVRIHLSDDSSFADVFDIGRAIHQQLAGTGIRAEYLYGKDNDIDHLDLSLLVSGEEGDDCDLLRVLASIEQLVEDLA